MVIIFREKDKKLIRKIKRNIIKQNTYKEISDFKRGE